jgi:hypothetical protein
MSQLGSKATFEERPVPPRKADVRTETKHLSLATDVE